MNIKLSTALVLACLCTPLAAAPYDCVETQAIDLTRLPPQRALRGYTGDIKSVTKRLVRAGELLATTRSTFSREGILLEETTYTVQKGADKRIMKRLLDHESSLLKKTYLETDLDTGQRHSTTSIEYFPDKRLLVEEVFKKTKASGPQDKTRSVHTHFNPQGLVDAKVLNHFGQRFSSQTRIEFRYLDDARISLSKQYRISGGTGRLSAITRYRYDEGYIHVKEETCEHDTCKETEHYTFTCDIGYNTLGDPVSHLYLPGDDGWIIPVWTKKEALSATDKASLIEEHFQYEYFPD